MKALTVMGVGTYFSILLVLCISRDVFCSQCYIPPSVYDVSFFNELQDNCSLTIYWSSPIGCSHPVVRYTVQSAQGCPSKWTNFSTDGNKNVLVIEDLGLYAACLLGECHIRVAAEFDGADSKPVYSHCVAMGDYFHNSTFRQKYIGRQICIPIFTLCPTNTAPIFLINETLILWPSMNTEEDSYYISGNMLCFNNIESNQVVHEVCHIHTTCPGLCSEDLGEVILHSRTEIDVAPEGMNNSAVLEETECTPPSVIMFCDNYSTYPVNISMMNTICLCLPFNELQNKSSADDITIKLDLKTDNAFSVVNIDFKINGSMNRTVILSPTTYLQCFQVEFFLLENQTDCVQSNKSTSFDLCLSHLSSTSNYIQILLPCINILLFNNVDGTFGTDTPTVIDDSSNVTVTYIVVIVFLILMICLLLPANVFLIMVCIFYYRVMKPNLWGTGSDSESCDLDNTEEQKENNGYQGSTHKDFYNQTTLKEI